MKMEQKERSETSAYKIQTPGSCPEESTQHTEHGESLKSRIFLTAITDFNILLTVHLNVFILISTNLMH